MRFIVDKNKLTEALDITAGVVAKKAVNPVLQNISIKTREEGGIEISATDLEISVIIDLDAEVIEKGEMVVLNSLIRDIVKSVDEKTFEFVEESAGKIYLKAGSFKAELHSLSKDDFPHINIEELNTAPSFFIQGSTLREMLEKNIPFAAKDDLRYTFNSVYFEKENLELKTVSSDTKRLSLAKTFIDEGIADFTMLVPVKTARIIKDILGDQELEIKILNKKTGFVYGNITLISNQIEGKFPDYKMVIPKETHYNILLPKEIFASKIRSIAPFLSGEVLKVVLSFQNKKLTLYAEETEIGRGEASMEVDYEGDTLDIALNYRFLTDILNAVDKGDIMIKIWEPEKPIVFIEKDNDRFIFVTVPMKK
ncbi:MAG: DNA polymerase III subunit beta [Spirochaetes bacterium GWB1_36_13]|nr:MAG: DNA polymerase III subunit beta [Spirochaetes bacterium GWB1_36_13]